MDLVVARADFARRSITKPRLASLPSSPSTASEPRWSQMPARFAAVAAGGEHRIVLLAPNACRRALAIAVEQARHFRREQHRRPARRRFADRRDQRARHWRPGRSRCCDWKRAIRVMVMPRATRRACPSRSSAIRSSQPPTCLPVDEDLRDRRPPTRALDHLLPVRSAEIDHDLLDTRRPWNRADASPDSNRGRSSSRRFRPRARILLSPQQLGQPLNASTAPGAPPAPS